MSSELSDIDSVILDMEDPATERGALDRKPQAVRMDKPVANANTETNLNGAWTEEENKLFRDILKAQWEKEKIRNTGERSTSTVLFTLINQELKNCGFNRGLESCKTRWHKKVKFEKEFQSTFDFSRPGNGIGMSWKGAGPALQPDHEVSASDTSPP